MKSHQFKTYFLKPNLLNEETASELKEITQSYPWFHLAWILYAKNLKQIKSADFDRIVKEAIVRVGDRKLFFNFLNSSETFLHETSEVENVFLLPDENEKNDVNSDSLIDRFLSSSTSSIRRKSNEDLLIDNSSHDDLIERSSTEDDEMITETLANIYLQQKKYDKAIHAFEKLSLKYPEKSIYFANRIKETEGLRNIN